VKTTKSYRWFWAETLVTSTLLMALICGFLGVALHAGVPQDSEVLPFLALLLGGGLMWFADSYTMMRWASRRFLKKLQVFPGFKAKLFEPDYLEDSAAIWASYCQGMGPSLPFEAFLARRLLIQAQDWLDLSDVLHLVTHLTRTPFERQCLSYALNIRVFHSNGQSFTGVVSHYETVEFQNSDSEVVTITRVPPIEDATIDISGSGNC
jgi:hypothetical protein